MCKRIMPHFQKAATQLRGHFVSEAQGPGGAGCFPAGELLESRGRRAGWKGRAGFEIVTGTYPMLLTLLPWRVVQTPVLGGC